jgi:YidC/Oxa1 family membrane protein insertase
MMDTRRIILFAIFCFSLVMLWDAWQKQQAKINGPLTSEVVPGKASAPAAPSDIPRLGSQPAPSAVPGAAPAAGAASVPGAPAAAAAATMTEVKTDLFIAGISSEGGTLRYLEFTQHKDANDKDKDFVLFGTHDYAAETGLLPLGPGADLPTHRSMFTVVPGNTALKPGEDQLKLRLEATAGAIRVAKIYTFHRGSYLIDVDYEIANGGPAPIAPTAYLQLERDGKPPAGETRFMSTFTGAAFYTDKEKFKKESFADIEKGKAEPTEPADDGWVAIIQHYFTAGWLPQGNAHREFYTKKVGEDLYSAGLLIPVGSIAPGATGSLKAKLYAGPEEIDRLREAGPGFDRVKDYGWLRLIAEPMYQLLNFLHGYLGNWGLSIIALTLIVKGIFFPLSAASYKSMARMKKVTPKMTAIREKFGDDRMKMNQAMMELYKTEKINPLGGCLPVVIQVPVFISLYWALLATVELRHAPFYGWITDLSAPDTLFGTLPFLGGIPVGLLPIIMATSMFLQTKMNPAPPDPVQAKMMAVMPIVFSAFFFFFPAGLVLYYVVNNILSIAQQWSITRLIVDKDAKPEAEKAETKKK